MNKNRFKVILLFSWLGVTIAGAVVSIFSGHAIDGYIPIISEAFVSSLFIVQGATIISFLQSLVLKNYISRAWLWTPATFLGILFGTWVTRFSYGSLAFFNIFGFVISTSPWICGILVGVLQWFVLRKQLIGSSLWILTSTLGFVISFSSIYIFYIRGGFEVDWIIIWLIYGLIQAVTLVWLLQNRSRDT